MKIYKANFVTVKYEYFNILKIITVGYSCEINLHYLRSIYPNSTESQKDME